MYEPRSPSLLYSRKIRNKLHCSFELWFVPWKLSLQPSISLQPSQAVFRVTALSQFHWNSKLNWNMWKCWPGWKVADLAYQSRVRSTRLTIVDCVMDASILQTNRNLWRRRYKTRVKGGTQLPIFYVACFEGAIFICVFQPSKVCNTKSNWFDSNALLLWLETHCLVWIPCSGIPAFSMQVFAIGAKKPGLWCVDASRFQKPKPGKLDHGKPLFIQL